MLVTFVAPVADMLFRPVEKDIGSEALPRTVIALRDRDGQRIPDEETFRALAAAAEQKNHTRLDSRLIYEDRDVEIGAGCRRVHRHEASIGGSRDQGRADGFRKRADGAGRLAARGPMPRRQRPPVAPEFDAREPVFRLSGETGAAFPNRGRLPAIRAHGPAADAPRKLSQSAISIALPTPV